MDLGTSPWRNIHAMRRRHRGVKDELSDARREERREARERREVTRLERENGRLERKVESLESDKAGSTTPLVSQSV